MAINYRKLKSQIYIDWNGYIFIATDIQKQNFIESVAFNATSKRALIKFVVKLIYKPGNEDWREEFTI